MFSVPTLLSLCGALAPQNPATQDPTPVLDFVSLHAACPRLVELQPMPWLTMLDTEGMQDVLGATGNDHVLAPEQVLGILRTLDRAAYESGELVLDYYDDDGALMVRGARETVATVRAQVDTIAATIGRALDLEFAVWASADAAMLPAVMTPQQYHDFCSGREPLWRRRATTQSSVAVALEGGSRTRYVRDYEVEIAKKAAMQNPVLAQFFTGGVAHVLPFALVGSDEFALHVQAVWAERRDHGDRADLAMQDTAELDAPTVASASAGFSGRIHDGGALCAVFAGDSAAGASCVMTISLRTRAPLPQPQSHPGSRAYPIGAITTMASTSGPDLPPSAFEPPNGSSEDASGSFLDSARVAELLKTTIPEDQADAVAIEVVNGWLLAHGPEAWCERADAFLTRIQDRLLRTQTVVHELRARSADPGRTLVHRMQLPTLLGRRLQATRRVETPVLHDIDVEVAEDSRIADPIVRTRQLGCWLTGRILRDRNTPELELQILEIAGGPLQDRRLDTLGKIAIGATAAQTARYDGELPLDGTIDHGDGPVLMLEGQACRSVSETSVR